MPGENVGAFEVGVILQKRQLPTEIRDVFRHRSVVLLSGNLPEACRR
ncbi:MAG: hypothetical protein WC807_20185 [Hyphomicrobium sp.]